MAIPLGNGSIRAGIERRYRKYFGNPLDLTLVPQIDLLNNDPLLGVNAAGTTCLPIIKLNASDVVEVGGSVFGASVSFANLTELLTIAAAATSATTIQIPANAVVLAVSARVTVAIPTAATFTVTGTGDATVFNTVAVPVAINTTNVGTKSCPFYNATAQTITITPNSTPGTAVGRVRINISYYISTPSTS